MTSESSLPEMPMEGETVTIVRYPNRRLYDKTQGKYVTLAHVADLVRGGNTVEVRDSKTGEDLTRTILTQILLEQHPDRMELLPIPILHMMIQANDMVLEFLRQYLQQALTLVDMMHNRTPFTPWFATTEWMKPVLSGIFHSESEKEVASSQRMETEQLSKRIAELEETLENLQAKLDQTTGDKDNRGATSSKKGSRKEAG